MTRTISLDKDMLQEQVKSMQDRIVDLEAEKITLRGDLEAQIRREWEVKARLEIDRQVKDECDKRLAILQSQFEDEVCRRVKEQLGKQNTTSTNVLKENPNPPASNVHREHSNYHSSTNTAGDTDWTNTTDLTELSDLSIHSPSNSTSKNVPHKKAKTPFARSKTTFDSPADIMMADPSPISITSLNLSPRRQTTSSNKLSGKHLFNKIATNKARLTSPDDLDEDKENELEDSDDEFVPDLPSPTRPKLQNTDPFKMPPPANMLPSKARPGLQRQQTVATMDRMVTKPNLFPTTGSSATAQKLRAGFAAASAQPTQPSQIPRSATEGELSRKPSSPTQSSKRRLSKIPSRGDLAAEIAMQVSTVPNNGSTSPLRRAATITNAGPPSTKLQSKLDRARTGLSDGTQQVNVVAGRTRVELAQARAGGRPMSADCDRFDLPPPRGIRVVEKDLPPVPVWDPEVLGEDAMPSPFLKRDSKMIRGLR